MNIRTSIFILIAALVLAGCGAPTAQPTATSLPSPTATITLTETPLPSQTPTVTLTATVTATPTLEPTATEEPSATPEAGGLPLPVGTPEAEWQGVPVMPDAIAGDGDEETYLFTVEATAKEVQAYYETELKKLGWSAIALGQGSTKGLLLMFQKGEEIVTIAVIDPEDDSGLMHVMIVK